MRVSMKNLPCQECGGQCCTPPGMNAHDAKRIMRYTTYKVEQVQPNLWMLCDSWDTNGNTLEVCPAFDTASKLCSIYKFRPNVCKVYGIEKSLPCLYLYPEKQEYYITGRAKKVLDKFIKN